MGMITHRGVRYREEDAKRLGLVADGKVLTPNSVRRDATTNAPTGAAGHSAVIHTGQQAGQEDLPAKSATKADWTAYALANGKTEEDLKDLKRDDIAALFHTSDSSTNE